MANIIKQSAEVQDSVYQKILTHSPDSSLMKIVGGSLGSNNLVNFYSINDILTLAADGLPCLVNSLEYLSNFPTVTNIPKNSKEFYIDVTYDMLSSVGKLIFSHFLSLLGLNPGQLPVVGVMCFDTQSMSYKWGSVARLVKSDNNLYIVVGKDYLVPISYSGNRQLVNDNVIAIRYAEYYDVTKDVKNHYFLAILRDKNKWGNYKIPMRADSNINQLPDDFIECWESNNIAEISISELSTKSYSFAKVFNSPFDNGLLNEPIVMLCTDPEFTPSYGGTSKWAVSFPSYLSDIPLENGTLGDVKSLYFTANTLITTLLVNNNYSKDLKIMVVVSNIDTSTNKSPSMVCLLSASPFGIPNRVKEHPDAMDFITLNLPEKLVIKSTPLVPSLAAESEVTFDEVPF